MPRDFAHVYEDVINKPRVKRLVTFVCNESYRWFAMGRKKLRVVVTPNFPYSIRPLTPAPGTIPALKSKPLTAWRTECVPTYPARSTKPAPRSRSIVKLYDSMYPRRSLPGSREIVEMVFGIS